MRIPLFRTSRVAVALAGALALSACGTDKEAKARCLRDAYNAAEVAAVARMYDEGKLGTRKRVESELGVPGRPGASFFDGSGHLLPYLRLDVAHKNQLLLWINNGRVAELTYDERQRARAQTHPDC